MKQLIMLSVILVFCTSSAMAERWNIDNGGIFSSGTKAVIKGYDPVAYFKQSNAVKGDKSISSNYEGGTFHFSSEENKALFDANPKRYVPQYGGFCAYALAKNDLVSVDPTVWAIEDGKLYLNYNKSIGKDWEQNKASYIPQANKNWPALKQK